MVLVKLEAADELKLGHSDASVVESSVLLVDASSWLEWHKERHNERALTPFHDHHAFDHFWVRALGGKRAARANLTILILSTSAEMVQIQVVQGLANVIKVEGRLSFA